MGETRPSCRHGAKGVGTCLIAARFRLRVRDVLGEDKTRLMTPSKRLTGIEPRNSR